MNYIITKAEPSHVPVIAEKMRESDRREVWASHRQYPAEALAISLERSERAWTAVIDGEPALMWGVCRVGSILSSLGSPWLLGSTVMERPEVSREFICRSREHVALLWEGFSRLENFVHSENRLSLRWLKWCGFEIDAAPIIFNNEIFFHFAGVRLVSPDFRSCKAHHPCRDSSGGF